MKKIFILLIAVVVSMGAKAQFKKGTQYANASLTGFGIGYEKGSFAVGLSSELGYFVADGWMLSGALGYKYKSGVGGDAGGGIYDPSDDEGWGSRNLGSVYGASGSSHSLLLKAAFRYSFVQNGLNLGCGLQFEHAGTAQNYIQLCPQFGYTFYLNNKVSIEPALYADLCMNDFKYGTSVGLKVGVGLYDLFKKK
jgi:hypothetical protein